MPNIEAGAEIMTLINTFAVAPGNADRLIAMLGEATEKVMHGRPGFVSASFHKSEDGARVVNYAQWRTKVEFEAMLADPAAQEHMKQCADVAESFDPVIYAVIRTD